MLHPAYKPTLRFVLRLRLQKGGVFAGHCGTLRYYHWYYYLSFPIYYMIVCDFSSHNAPVLPAQFPAFYLTLYLIILNPFGYIMLHTAQKR